MAIASNNNALGHMRQRIVAVSRVDTTHGVLTRQTAHFVRDRRLRAFVESGAVTREQMEAAISAFAKGPSNFTWLTGIDGTILEKADRVFLATHGRPPAEDIDFHLNGDYHKICRSLQHDPHHYDQQLERVPRVDRQEVEEKTKELKNTGPDERRRVDRSRSPVVGEASSRGGGELPGKRSIWAFVTVLVLGFGSAPALGMMIATHFSGQDLMAGLVIVSLWLVVLLGALILTFPRQTS